MKTQEEGGSRIAIVFNGSPLFTGGPNSGESSIRRWIIENDWLEAIVGLPERLFYNTGIHTYIWILSNDKPKHRENKIQLIDATDLYEEMNRNLGEKSHRLNDEHIEEITRLFGDLSANGRSKVVSTEEFGYRRIVIDRPLRMNFEATEDRIGRLDDERAFTNRSAEKQNAIKEALFELPDNQVWKDNIEFREALNNIFEERGIDVSDSVIGNIENALGERDPEAEICRSKSGDPEHDTDLREYAKIPLGVDPHKYFEEEIEPHVPDAWINEESKRYDDKDGELGIVGYEINFNRHFYDYESPRPLSEINSDIEEVEQKIVDLLSAEVTNE